MACPLCLSESSQLYDHDKFRNYYKCGSCTLVFVDRSDLVGLNVEKERYEAHENSDDNGGYRTYLGRISDQIRPYLSSDQTGLDFGSGKTTILSELLKPFHVSSYDIFFFPDRSVLERSYDFIILSEVIEHLRDPLSIMKGLKQSLKPNGQFFIKTKFYPNSQKDFGNWFYKRDITHVQFFSDKSFNVLAKTLSMSRAIPLGEDLFILQ